MKKNSATWKFRLLAFAAAMVFSTSVALWAEQAKLTNTAIAPAASGVVNHSRDRNGNTEVELKVEHLAKPEALTPSKSRYVVWVQPRGGSASNVGTLQVNDDLSGSLEFTTPHRSFDLIVTAEDNGMSAQASTVEILRGTVQPR